MKGVLVCNHVLLILRGRIRDGLKRTTDRLKQPGTVLVRDALYLHGEPPGGE